MLSIICFSFIVQDSPVLNPTRGTGVLWGLIQLEEATLGLRNDSLVDGLHVLKESGQIRRINVDRYLQTQARF